MTDLDKERIKRSITEAIKVNEEVKKIVIFGSFLYSDFPGDLDIAIFETSSADYLTLAMKYRKQLRGIAAHTPLDIIPLKDGVSNFFTDSVNTGEVIYEKRN